MPKGLILLVLLLLIGGYFIFIHGGGAAQPDALPSLTGTAKVVSGKSAYTVVFNGALKLPRKGVEYNISSLVASLVVGGVPVKRQPLPTSVVRGPSTYPISFSPTIPSSASSVAIRIDANVLADGKDYGLSVEVPVALPDKSLLVRLPSVDVALTSVRLTGSSKDVGLEVSVYNPNGSDLSVKQLRLSLGSAVQDVPLSSVPAGKSASAVVDFTVPKDVTSLSLNLSGKFSVSGQEVSVSRSIDLNVPVLRPSPPVASVSAKYLGITSDGYSLQLSGTIDNPNDFPLVVDGVSIVISSGNVQQDVNVLGSTTILPDGNVSFSKKASVLFVFSKATAKVVAKYDGKDHVIAEFPVGVANPADFLSAPSVSLNVSRDANAETCSIQPVLSNSASYSLDLNNVVLSVGGTTKHYTISSLAKGSTVKLESVDVNAGQVVATLSGDYGLKQMGVWIPFTYSVELNCG